MASDKLRMQILSPRTYSKMKERQEANRENKMDVRKLLINPKDQESGNKGTKTKRDK